MSLDEEVDVIGHDLQGDDRPVVLCALLANEHFASGGDGIYQYRPPVLRAPHDVIAKVVRSSCSVGYEPRDALDYTGGACLVAPRTRDSPVA